MQQRAFPDETVAPVAQQVANQAANITASQPDDATVGDADEDPRGRDTHGFVANDVSIDALLDAISGQLKKPVIASARVRHKHVTGEFNLKRPYALLKDLGSRMSLLWYSDGSSIYIYDNSEIKNAMISMQNANVRNLRDFIKETHLYDARFPIRGDDYAGTFYVTGAPIYVNLVTAAARYLDQLRGGAGKTEQVVKVVRLQNSFVNDRRYTLRDKQVDIPGMATVLAQVYGNGGSPAASETQRETAQPIAASIPADSNEKRSSPFSLSDKLPKPADALTGAVGAQLSAATGVGAPGGIRIAAAGGVRAIAYPDTNSLVLVGPLGKVQDMEALIHSLDVAKRQIELSLWIIDIKKSCLDQLGVNWQAAFGVGPAGVSVNDDGNHVTTLDGIKFLASVKALAKNGDATVVSRPVVLTQENVPATFDSNQTFYAKLIGERSVQLDHVTYGTLVNVLPRLTEDGAEVEMVVDVEDGNTDATQSKDGSVTDDTLPLVNRTEINTVARVPREMSLLIGGNTRDDMNRIEHHIPVLGSIPVLGGLFRGHTERHEQMVRVFLIQPKLLRPDAAWQDGQQWEPGDTASNQTLRSTVQMLQPYMGRQ
ncbi:type III secretion protein [Burkholderia ubonensis]|uniref:type III secretion system outer membrane ring subunit SctC n=1 Tax=Burkholderia ubonensis TaxID=101571 RepID=UPI000751CA2C|nr:type III secretion protein [Burkholderia ubonensis]